MDLWNPLKQLKNIHFLQIFQNKKSSNIIIRKYTYYISFYHFLGKFKVCVAIMVRCISEDPPHVVRLLALIHPFVA